MEMILYHNIFYLDLDLRQLIVRLMYNVIHSRRKFDFQPDYY